MLICVGLELTWLEMALLIGSLIGERQKKEEMCSFMNAYQLYSEFAQNPNNMMIHYEKQVALAVC